MCGLVGHPSHPFINSPSSGHFADGISKCIIFMKQHVFTSMGISRKGAFLRFQFTIFSMLCEWQILIAHYNNIIMSAMASQITRLTIVYSSVYSGTDQRKGSSSASLAFVKGIHRWPVNSPLKRASNAEDVSVSWRHHDSRKYVRIVPYGNSVKIL